MQLIKAHIFSFDRPAQLELLIESILKYDIESNIHIYVQYACSNNNFYLGYQKLISKYVNVVFIQEERYKESKYTNPFVGNLLFNLLVWITNYRFRKAKSDFRTQLINSVSDTKYKYFMFLTDDSMFFRNIEIQDNILVALNSEKGSSYSLIFGLNILDGSYERNNTHLQWNVDSKSTTNIWTYSFSVDGRIYERDFLEKIINRVLFTNPNTFEGIMVAYNASKNVFTKIFSNLQSCLVGFELNKVQTEYDNNHIDIDQNYINELYLKGYKLIIEIDKNAISSFRPSIESVKMRGSNDVILLK